MSSPRSSVLVTGGAGFLGRPLVLRLVAEGCRVTVLDRAPPLPAPDLAVRWVGGDLADAVALRTALAGVEVVYHLACSSDPTTSAADPMRDAKENVVGSVRLFEESARHGVDKIVYPSSGGTVYGPARSLPIEESHPTAPISVHGVTKLATEGYLMALSRQRGFAACVLRLANPYGPGQWQRRSQGILGALLRSLATGEAITIWGNGTVIRDYFALEDAVRGLAAARLLGDGEVINLGSGRGYSIRDLVAIVERVAGRAVPVRWEPRRGFDVEANILSRERAGKVLGWRPQIGLEEGIRQMWAAYPAAASGASEPVGSASADTP